MFIYNITTKVTWTINEAWLAWMKHTHIPQIMATGCFTDHRFVKLLETDESEGPTYATQFYAASLDDYNRYIDLYAPALRKDSASNWGDQSIGFRSLMQLVN
jgi:hypothetical protein